MYECFHCGEKAVIWDGDFSFEDYCEEGEGIVHECHCTACGAKVIYRISLEEKSLTKCPFCKEDAKTKRYTRYDDWTCGCFNPSCKIKPKTKCMKTEEEAIREWEEAFVD